MNYIGSKQTLLPFIDEVLTVTIGDRIQSFTDGFAGTGIVSKNIQKNKPYTWIYANDIQTYSEYVTFARLHPYFYNCDFKLIKELNSLDGVEGFIYKTYASDGAMYFTPKNAKKCDAIRQKIEEWWVNGDIAINEYKFLIGLLIENIDKVANTTSVYGSFLKKYKTSALKEFSLLPLEEFSTFYNIDPLRVIVSKMDVVDLVKQQKNEGICKFQNFNHVLYLDPPYNERQYAAYYHVLETIALYDNPEVKGKTKMRDYSQQKSKWCNKKTAKQELEEVIKNAPQNHIYLSYNNEGIISFDEIKEIFEKYGEYEVFEKEYNRYKADSNREYKGDKTIEYIHYCHKTKDTI